MASKPAIALSDRRVGIGLAAAVAMGTNNSGQTVCRDSITGPDILIRPSTKVTVPVGKRQRAVSLGVGRREG